MLLDHLGQAERRVRDIKQDTALAQPRGEGGLRAVCERWV